MPVAPCSSRGRCAARRCGITSLRTGPRTSRGYWRMQLPLLELQCAKRAAPGVRRHASLDMYASAACGVCPCSACAPSGAVVAIILCRDSCVARVQAPGNTRTTVITFCQPAAEAGAGPVSYGSGLEPRLFTSSTVVLRGCLVRFAGFTPPHESHASFCDPAPHRLPSPHFT